MTALIMGVAAPKQTVSPTVVDKSTLIETAKEASAENVVKEDTIIKEEPGVSKENNESLPALTVPISDAEVKADEPDDIKEVKEKTEDESSESTSADSIAIEETDAGTDTPVQEEVVTPPAIDPMPDNETGFTNNGEIVEIRVISGDSSVSVSRRLYEAGLVESAVEFDQFLCQNGYDKFICVGTYDIGTGSDFETMAKILTKRN